MTGVQTTSQPMSQFPKLFMLYSQHSIYNSSVLIQDIGWKTYQEQWTIGMSGWRGSGKSVLAAHDDDDDDDDDILNDYWIIII